MLFLHLVTQVIFCLTCKCCQQMKWWLMFQGKIKTLPPALSHCLFVCLSSGDQDCSSVNTIIEPVDTWLCCRLMNADEMLQEAAAGEASEDFSVWTCLLMKGRINHFTLNLNFAFCRASKTQNLFPPSRRALSVSPEPPAGPREDGWKPDANYRDLWNLQMLIHSNLLPLFSQKTNKLPNPAVWRLHIWCPIRENVHTLTSKLRLSVYTINLTSHISCGLLELLHETNLKSVICPPVSG